MSLDLRDYQREAVEAIESAWADGITRPAVVLPTGTGKTVIFAHVAARAPGRTVILVHRDELVRQAVSKIRAVTPGAVVGIVKAVDDDVHAETIVASVQTLARPHRLERLGAVETVIVDECHHATAASYRRVMDGLGARAVGVTATMGRGDGARLGEVWQKIVYQQDIISMIRRGWLADVKGIQVKVADLDLSDVRRSGGDYAEGDLGRAIGDSLAPSVIAESLLEHAAGMPAIMFAPTVDTAHLLADATRAVGLRTGVVWGAQPTDERRATLAAYEAGELDVLSNCMVLTEGFDSPRARVAVIARPTSSTPLYVQMVGRVLRPYPGKVHALVLDVVGASAAHPLATLASLAGRKVRAAEGKTLLEAWDEDPTPDASRAPEEWTEGEIRSEAVDLFHGSRQAWQRTKAGTWFNPAGERFIVLAERGGTYNVMSFNQRSGGAWIARDVADLGYAMAHGEAAITPEEEMYAAKQRSWRKRKGSEKQIMFYTRLSRAAVEPTIRAGELSDLISIELASRRIDRALAGAR